MTVRPNAIGSRRSEGAESGVMRGSPWRSRSAASSGRMNARTRCDSAVAEATPLDPGERLRQGDPRITPDSPCAVGC